MLFKAALFILGSVALAFVSVRYLIEPPRRLAPPGTFYLVQNASITTSTGITGLAPGTRVELIEDHGAMVLVSWGGARLQVPADMLTNDLDLAELAGKQDIESRMRFNSYLGEQRAGASEHQQKLTALWDQQQQDANQRRINAAIAQAHHSALNRGSYDQHAGVSWSPYVVYPYSTSIYAYPARVYPSPTPTPPFVWRR